VVNEIFQWVVLVGVLFLLLGAFRQIALSLPSDHRAQTFSGPSIGRRLPRSTAKRIEALTVSSDSTQGAVVAFVSESCAACQRLLANLATHEDSVPVVVVARRPSLAFQDALARLSRPLIFDDGEVWHDCRITNTPLVVRLDQEGKVSSKGVTHDIDAVPVPA
jgi:hypothetical protein